MPLKPFSVKKFCKAIYFFVFLSYKQIEETSFVPKIDRQRPLPYKEERTMSDENKIDQELSDSELDAVAGGGCSGGNDPNLEVGIVVRWDSPNAQHTATCSHPNTFEVIDVYQRNTSHSSDLRITVKCTECGMESSGMNYSELYNI